MSSVAGQTALLSGFVRGDEDWQSLCAIGINIGLTDGVQVEIPASIPTFTPVIEDLATGLLRYWAVGGELARVWAQVLLATTPVDLIALEISDDGNHLLEALWDLADGRPVTESAVDVARKHTSAH
jgi:hypothetical protein